MKHLLNSKTGKPGLEKRLEQKVPERERRWQLAEKIEGFGTDGDSCYEGYPLIPDPDARNLTPETSI